MVSGVLTAVCEGLETSAGLFTHTECLGTGFGKCLGEEVLMQALVPELRKYTAWAVTA